MADSTLPPVTAGATATSAALDESGQDDAPLPLNSGPIDPEKAGDRSKSSGKVRPGARWKDQEVQNIPKK